MAGEPDHVPIAPPQANWVRLERMVPPLVHALRNTLAALEMALDLADARLVAAASPSPSLRAAAAPVLARTGELLEDLLALARPKVMACGAFDLIEVVRQVADEAQQQAREVAGAPAAPLARELDSLAQPKREEPTAAPQAWGKLSFSLSLPAQAHACGNRHAFAQALAHVVLNARQATAHALAASIAVSVAPDAQGWAVTVADDGPGVPSHLRGQIFSPFVSYKRGHLGLGLTTSWRNMRAQGGSLELAPAAAEAKSSRVHGGPALAGARFCLRLPSAAGQAE